METSHARGTTLRVRNGLHFAISADGHHKGGPRVQKELIHVVQTYKGQETLTPEEFAKRYN